MFVVVLTYVKPLEELDASMKAHVAFLRECYRANVFIASGRQVPRTGGVILARGVSRAELEELMARDPFIQRGLATHAIIEFKTSQHDPAFKPFADPPS